MTAGSARKLSSEASFSKLASELSFLVSVGNIAFGGRGKTPTVAHVAQVLRDAGERVAILSRGYGRRVVEDGAVVVSDGVHLLADVDRAGDEPLMLARALPGVAVVVCDQRAIAAALATHTLGATTLVLDDGFQHRQVARDVDLVLVTPEDVADRRAPFGRLRESPSALDRADAVLWDCPDPGARQTELGGEFAQTRLRAQFHVHRHTRPPAGLPAGARVWVLAGVAGPARVVRAAADAGLDVAGTTTPGDHHRYTRADITRLARDVRAHHAVGVLTTAKDAERLRPFRPLPFDVHVLEHAVTLEPLDAGAPFAEWLLARRDAARGIARAQRTAG